MIRVEKLSKIYTTGIFNKRRFTAVDGVSFTIAPGETLGLVGESGCGKTTLARLILRLTAASGGRVFFKGRNVFAAPPREMGMIRRKMQIIFQHPETALNPRRRIYDSMAEPLRLHKLVRDRAEEGARIEALLAQVGLHKELLTRYPYTLSGGQVQRVVLARILALGPEFIVADEPTSMLDVSVQARVLNILKELQRRHRMACLFISHDLDLVRAVSDRIGVMHQGRLVEIGPADSTNRRDRPPWLVSPG